MRHFAKKKTSLCQKKRYFAKKASLVHNINKRAQSQLLVHAVATGFKIHILGSSNNIIL